MILSLKVQSQESKTFEDSFLDKYNEALLNNELENQQETPKDYFRPSSLGGGCKRMLVYQRLGIERSKEDLEDEWTYNIIGICDSGTDRHERIQKIVANMDGVETLDIEELVKEANQLGVNTSIVSWNKSHTECRCINEDYKISFQPDGAFRFNKKECLLEIKTTSMFQFQKLNAPKWEHIRQATLYALGLNMRYVLFFYEDRNFTRHKLFLFEVTEDLKQEMMEKVRYLEECLKNNILPPKEEDKCTYCDYKGRCFKDGK